MATGTEKKAIKSSFSAYDCHETLSLTNFRRQLIKRSPKSAVSKL